jgi:NAD(P)H-flavin reductase
MLPQAGQSPLLFAGGIGLGPVLFLYNELKAQGLPARFFYGARSKPLVPRECLPENAEIYTDDGSLGAQGRPAEIIASGELGANPIVYACGPKPMLSRLAELTEARGIPCYVSVEQNMACGVGACMGCNVLVRDERGSVRACAEGPVFDAKELLWN